jgi:hypothetical protein
MQQVTIYAPINDNDGQSNETAIRAILARIVASWRGYTVLPGVASGAWLDPADGIVYFDESRVIQVLVELDVEVEAIRRAASGWAAELGQIALLMTVQPLVAHFIERVPVAA